MFSAIGNEPVHFFDMKVRIALCGFELLTSDRWIHLKNRPVINSNSARRLNRPNWNASTRDMLIAARDAWGRDDVPRSRLHTFTESR